MQKSTVNRETLSTEGFEDLTRWIALLLLPVLMIVAVHNLAPQIENDVHTRVVVALADEGLSEIRAQVDGRNVFLSGPDKYLSEALQVVSDMDETDRIRSQTTGDNLNDWSSRNDESIAQVIHPDATYWPPKSVPGKNSQATLMFTKDSSNISVNGSVPDHEIQQAILSSVKQLVDIPAHLFDVTIDKVKKVPVWHKDGLPLMIPFIQWIEKGQIQYLDDKIKIDGTVLNSNAREALEAAIADLPSGFQIEKNLRRGAKEY